MREKELRIALVCFGGVSLAIYMHGISKEILKLVRASRTLHAIADRSWRAQASFFDLADRNDSEYDTEDIYFELLRDIGRSVELRVVVANARREVRNQIGGVVGDELVGLWRARPIPHI